MAESIKIVQRAAESNNSNSLSGNSSFTSQDLAFFQNATKESNPGMSNVMLEGVIGTLTDLEKRKKKVDQAIKSSASGDGNNGQELTNTLRTISKFHLKHMLATKVISKSIQAVEKLVNLQ